MRNNKTHYKKYKKEGRGRKKTHKRSQGGKAVDAGSYGCVFSPALKCADKTIPYKENYISKLMHKRDADLEIIEMKKVEKYIKNIPNNDKYFLVADTSICNPADITNKEDLKSFDETCGLYTKEGIDSYNVNQSLNKLSLINMPNGGLSIENFIYKWIDMPDKYQVFIKLNNALIQLLVNGIVPLNKLGFHHYDVKSGNILFSQDGNARLIDWGLASSNDGVVVPDAIKNRSIAFNMPFSDIFFNNYIQKWLPEEYIKIKAASGFKGKNDGQADLLKVIAVNLINKSIQETSEGHYEYITANILHDIYKLYSDKNSYNKLDFNVLTFNVLIEYIQAVLMKFVDENGNFNAARYFYEVFAHNVDIWGFIIAYAPIIEDGYGKVHKDIINGVCRILLKYCFSSEFAIKPITITELVADLSSLNDIAASIPTVNMPPNLQNKLQSKLKFNAQSKEGPSKMQTKGVSKVQSKFIKTPFTKNRTMREENSDYSSPTTNEIQSY